MTKLQNIGRRGFLKGVSAAGVGLAGMSGVGTAKKPSNTPVDSRKQALKDKEVDVLLFWSDADDTSSEPNTVDQFGFNHPHTLASPGQNGLFLGYTDPSPGGLFDTSEIEMTPNGQTLHHILKFFHGLLMKRQPKPYVLKHTGDGRYVSRGEVVNFTAKSQGTIAAELEGAASALGVPKHKAGALAQVPPISTLAGGRWRGVGVDRIQLKTENGNPTTTPEWGLTRVDFYSQSHGNMGYTLSLLYYIVSSNANRKTKGTADEVTVDELIQPGRRNLGGQPKYSG